MAGKHRATRPRYGRLTALTASVSVVAVSLVASAGGWEDPSGEAVAESSTETVRTAVVPETPPPAAPAASAPVAAAAADPRALPPGSGQGRRVVFDQSAQRVWLVGRDDRVERTYLASGSVLDNLHPGTYHVYSRSRWAVGVDDSGVMEYFVRFTHGPSGAAIGFHTIPTKDGVPLQTESQLGTPRSHGCIRQRTKDAIALWEFAPEGTAVVVVA